MRRFMLRSRQALARVLLGSVWILLPLMPVLGLGLTWMLGLR